MKKKWQIILNHKCWQIFFYLVHTRQYAETCVLIAQDPYTKIVMRESTKKNDLKPNAKDLGSLLLMTKAV